jgi:hypothetical protein
MTYRGRVANGVVVLEAGIHLREGSDVRVEVVQEVEVLPETSQTGPSQEVQSLRKDLLACSGVVKGGPSDLARNHDHYLHGTPRR